MTEFWQVSFPIPGRSETIARNCESAGWDGLCFPDTQCLAGDVYGALCLAAKATSSLKLMVGVTNPVTRHAAVTASAIATVQVESEGRAILGMGRGDSSLGYLGQNPAPPAVLETYITQVQCYLSGEAVDLDGFDSRNMWIEHSGQAKVPVDLAATGPKVIAIGGRHAERVTFAMGADPVRLKAAIAAAREAREAVSENPNDLSFGAYVNIACDSDVDRARAILKGSVGTFAHFSGMSTAASTGLQDVSIFRDIGANYDMANHAAGAAGHMKDVPEDFISRFAITGDEGYCIERLQELVEVGLDRIICLTGSRDSDPADTEASQRRLSSGVFDRLR